MDRPVSNSHLKKDRNRKILKWGIALIMLALLLLLLRNLFSTSAEKNEFRIVTVEQGDMENNISASGLVIPAYEVVLNSPISGDIQKVHFNNGDHVKPGDLILELDAESTQLSYDQLKDQLELKKNNVSLLKMQYDKNLADLEADDTIMGLRLQNLTSLLSDEQRLQSIGGSSQEKLEQAGMNLKIAQWEKKKLENELAYKKRSLNKEKRNLELEVQIQEKKLIELKKKLEKTQVRAPQESAITWLNQSIGKKVSEGEVLVKLADLSSYKIEASFSDLYSENVKVDMEVRVRINRTNLRAHIESIQPKVENNTVKCNLILDEPSHELLRPNMRVEIFIILNRKKDVLRASNGPAFTGGKEQEVFVVVGDYAEKRKLQVGLNNTDFVELSGNIKAGDRIIVSDMKNYLHLDKIKLSD